MKKFTCRKPGCGKRHHFLIHPPDKRNTTDPAVKASSVLNPFHGQKIKENFFRREVERTAFIERGNKVDLLESVAYTSIQNQ